MILYVAVCIIWAIGFAVVYYTWDGPLDLLQRSGTLELTVEKPSLFLFLVGVAWPLFVAFGLYCVLIHKLTCEKGGDA